MKALSKNPSQNSLLGIFSYGSPMATRLLGTLMALLISLGMSNTAQANDSYTTTTKGDSVIVNFGKGGRMVVYMESLEDMEEAKKIDFNEIIKSMQTYIDSAKQTSDGKLAITNEFGTFQIYTEEAIEEKPEAIYLDIEDGLRIRVTGKNQDKKPSKTASYTDFYFGINNFMEDGKIPDGTSYDLRPSGSRYFELAFRRQVRLGGDKSKLFLNYAISFSWYNFMFEGNQYATNQNGKVGFDTYTAFPLKKSKLTASYINLPLMLKFKSKKFSLAAGGYVGYRLGSHSKIKYLDERSKWEIDKESGRFGLENVRYGLRAELNWVGPTIFASYDMNDVFTANSGGPKLNVLTFGIKL